jgi:N utilization substance protein B
MSAGSDGPSEATGAGEPTTSDGPAEAGRRHRESPAGSRRRARTLVLQALYEADTSGHDPASSIERLLTEKAASEESAAFSRALIGGIKSSRTRVDGYIRQVATQWPIEQLAVVDRNILRIAIYEMLIENETPVRVAVNEAVELAKAFGSDSSPRFVNGVLGALSALRSD